jgi:hypothetical protein
LLAKAPVLPLNILWLRYRFREQAHSHKGQYIRQIFSGRNAVCGSELAREGAGTSAEFLWLRYRFLEQAHSHKGQYTR